MTLKPSGEAKGEFFAAGGQVATVKLAHPIPNQVWVDGQAVALKMPAGLFTEAGNPNITISVTGAGKLPLPSWLSYNAATGTLSGVVPANDVEHLSLLATGTDPSGNSAADLFSVTIGSAKAPVLTHALPDVKVPVGQTVKVVLPQGAFVDPQHEALTYSAQANYKTLPSWLHFDPAHQTFTSTLSKTASADMMIEVTATDTAGLSVVGVFHLHIH